MDNPDEKVNNINNINNINEENEEIKIKLQIWIDENFKCPSESCQSQNNVFEVKEVINCNCAEGCLMKLAFIVGGCNRCGKDFMGYIEASKMDDSGKRIVHKIVERRMRHVNN